MNHQHGRTLQQARTTLAPAEALAAATRFFAGQLGIYAAFPEKSGPTYVNLRGQGGEELVVGVAVAADGATVVTGSSYLFDMQVARFLSTLPPAPEPAPAGPVEVAGDPAAAAPGGAA
jgi:hypothetical protein